ncbi:hypothetical protein [Nonomuraea sp. NPDC049129]|uniref:hypothetical protein n=1 Tax=Nonomuraea sp. NPDC049129 TaxID=3155272 RepID=UPI00341199F2
MSISIKNVEFLNACAILQDLDTGLNYPIPSGDCWIDYSASGTAHNTRVHLDGVAITVSDPIDADTPAGERLYWIPNDGLKHTVTVIDDGTKGTTAARSTETIVPIIPCDGLLAFDVLGESTHPITREKYVHVSVTHTQMANKPLWVEFYRTLDYSSGPQVEIMDFWISPGERRIVKVVIPADAKRHAVYTKFRFGNSYDGQGLWYTTQANYPPPPVEDPSKIPAVFLPGETIVVDSSPTGTPLATDGSEWVMLEISSRDADTWTPVGTEGGFITPQQDGTWTASIPTDSVTFPKGSKWDLRARRFREFRPSEEVIRQFDIDTSDVPTPPPPARPLILGESDLPKLGTWLNLVGTGTPSSVIEFEAVSTDPGGSEAQISVPPSTTVGPDGTWKTRIRQSTPTNSLGSAPVAYRARARLNGATSEWSPAYGVTWQNADW